MEEQFYTILTSIGKAKIANSNVFNTKLNLTKFQVGDGGGSYYAPTEAQTQLKNKVWEGSINSIRTDADNPSWIVIEVVIPSNQGGFTIREAGVFDDEGNLIAIGKYPETFKPHIDNGSSKDLFIRMILEISNTQNITLKVDPTVIMATKKDIEIIESRLKGLEDRVSIIENNLKDNSLEVLKTDVQLTPLAGCSGGFVNVESVQGKTELLDGKLVSVGEAIPIGNNLFNKNTALLDKYIDFQSGGIANAPSFYASDFIPIDSAKTYIKSAYQQYAFFDTNKTYIAGDKGLTNKIITPPSTAKYIRITVPSTNVNDTYVFAECQYRIEILSNGGKNLFDKKIVVYNKGISTTTGEEFYSATSNISGFCYVTPNTIYKKINISAQGVFFYDKDKKFINNILTTTTNNFTTPSNCRYVKLHILTTDNIDNIMLVLSTDTEDYEPYKRDKTEILMKEPLMEFDVLHNNGDIDKKSKELLINGSGDWAVDKGFSGITTTTFLCYYSELISADNIKDICISEKLPSYPWYLMASDKELPGIAQNSNKYLIIRFLNSILSIQNSDSDELKLSKFKSYVQNNNIRVCVQVVKTTLNTNKTLILKAHDNLIVNAGAVQPEVTYSYAKNVGERLVTIEDSLVNFKTNIETSLNEVYNNDFKNQIDKLNTKVNQLDQNQADIVTNTELTPLNGFKATTTNLNRFTKYGKVCNININILTETATFPFNNLTIFKLPNISNRVIYGTLNTDKGNVSVTIAGVDCSISSEGLQNKPVWIKGSITYIE